MNQRTRTNPGNASTPANRPVHSIRYGAIKASIWRTETDSGPMFNVTFQRAYKDGDEWKSSGSFGHANLLVVSLLAQRAFEWVAERSASPSPEGPEM